MVLGQGIGRGGADAGAPVLGGFNEGRRRLVRVQVTEAPHRHFPHLLVVVLEGGGEGGNGGRVLQLAQRGDGGSAHLGRGVLGQASQGAEGALVLARGQSLDGGQPDVHVTVREGGHQGLHRLRRLVHGGQRLGGGASHRDVGVLEGLGQNGNGTHVVQGGQSLHRGSAHPHLGVAGGGHEAVHGARVSQPSQGLGRRLTNAGVRVLEGLHQRVHGGGVGGGGGAALAAASVPVVDGDVEVGVGKLPFHLRHGHFVGLHVEFGLLHVPRHVGRQRWDRRDGRRRTGGTGGTAATA